VAVGGHAPVATMARVTSVRPSQVRRGCTRSRRGAPLSAPDGAQGDVTRTQSAQWPATASRLSTGFASPTTRPATAATSQILADASRKTRLVSGVADLNGLFESLLAGRRPADRQAAAPAGTRSEAPVAAEGESPGAAGRHRDLLPAAFLAEAAPAPRAAPLTRADWPATAALIAGRSLRMMTSSSSTVFSIAGKSGCASRRSATSVSRED
jgi:hypothetical protein